MPIERAVTKNKYIRIEIDIICGSRTLLAQKFMLTVFISVPIAVRGVQGKPIREPYIGNLSSNVIPDVRPVGSISGLGGANSPKAKVKH